MEDIEVQVVRDAQPVAPAEIATENNLPDPSATAAPKAQKVEGYDEENPSCHTGRSLISVGSEGPVFGPKVESQINMAVKIVTLTSDEHLGRELEAVEEEKKEERKSSESSDSSDESIPSELSHRPVPSMLIGGGENEEPPAAPATPEWITFVVETLGFRREKIDLMSASHVMGSPEEFLNTYAPDKEGGLHCHSFVPPEAPDSEQKCRVCDQ